jgi:hypothetical protein
MTRERLTALEDVAALATIGATYPELMLYLQAEMAKCEQALAAPVQPEHISPKQLLSLAQEANLGLDKVIEVFRMAAQPAPVQEPVAWWNGEYGSPVFGFKRDTPGIGLGNPDAKPLYTTPPAQPAPAPMAHIVGEIDHSGKVWTPSTEKD